jgi:hypothetical protein
MKSSVAMNMGRMAGPALSFNIHTYKEFVYIWCTLMAGISRLINPLLYRFYILPRVLKPRRYFFPICYTSQLKISSLTKADDELIFNQQISRRLSRAGPKAFFNFDDT